MPFNVQVFGYTCVTQAPQNNQRNYASNGPWELQQPYNWSQTLVTNAATVNGAVAVSTTVVPNDTSQAIAIQVPDGHSIRFEVNPPGRRVSAGDASPKASGFTLLRWGAGYTLSIIEGVAGAVNPVTQFLVRLVTQPTPARRAAYTNLINTLVQAGVWQQLDALYILAAADAPTANTNLVQAAGTLTPINSPVFTVDQGYLCSGGSFSRLDTGINPATFGGHYSTSSATMFGWPLNYAPLKQGVNLGAQNSFVIGTLSTQDSLSPSAFGGGEGFTAEIVDGSTFQTTPSPAATGMYAGDRSGTTIGAYYDGYLAGSATHGVLGSVFNGGNFLIGVANDTTVANNYSPNPIAAAGFGGSLGAAGQLALYNAVNTYLTTIGAIATDPAMAFLNRLQTAPTLPRQTLYRNLINGLVSDGVWSKLDILWVFAAADIQTSRTNLVQDRYVVQDSPNGAGDIAGNIPFVADTGYGPLGNTNQSNTFGSWLFDPSLPNFVTAKYLTNDAHCMLFRQNDVAVTGSPEEMTFNGNHTSGTLINAKSQFGHAFGEINTNEGIGSGNADITLANNTAIGMTTISRSSSAFCTLYANRGAPPGDTVQTANQNRVSLALAPGPIVFGQTQNLSFCAASSGRSLTATDVQNLYHRLYTYLHAVGAI